jgi:hypothetical protein
MDWYATLDIVGFEYGFTKQYCLYKLTLPDVLNYLNSRNARYEAQNAAMEKDTEPQRSAYTGPEKKVDTVDEFSMMLSGKVNKLMNGGN